MRQTLTRQRESNKSIRRLQMKKSLIVGLTAAVIGVTAPVFAASGFWDRLGDRIDRRIDARGERIEERLDNRGDRINERLDVRGDRWNERLDARGDRIDEHFDNLAELAHAKGKLRRAERLDRRGDRIESRL